MSTSLLAALVYSRRRRSSPGRSLPGGPVVPFVLVPGGRTTAAVFSAARDGDVFIGWSVPVSLVSTLLERCSSLFTFPHRLRVATGGGVWTRPPVCGPASTDWEETGRGGEAEPASRMDRSGRRIHITALFFYPLRLSRRHPASKGEKAARRKTLASVLLLLLRVSVFVGVFVWYPCARTPVRRCDLVRDSSLSFACLPLPNPSIPQTDVLVWVSCPVCL